MLNAHVCVLGLTYNVRLTHKLRALLEKQFLIVLRRCEGSEKKKGLGIEGNTDLVPCALSPCCSWEHVDKIAVSWQPNHHRSGPSHGIHSAANGQRLSK